MRYQKILLSVVTLVTLFACSNSDKNAKSDDSKTKTEKNDAIADPNIIKVYVDETGVITANGNQVSLTELDSIFSKLKISKGTVYYSRANGAGDPPPGSMKIMDLIIKYQLPTRLYTDKTYSVIVK